MQLLSSNENSLAVIEESLGTKYFANLYVGVPTAEYYINYGLMYFA